MRQTEIQVHTADGLDLFAQEWSPDHQPRAIVCVMHGLGEHGGRYVAMAEALGRRGIALMALDSRGHGRSDGKRGHTPSHDALLSDIGLLIERVEARHPGLPVFLYGHSLGGNLVINYALRRDSRLAGLVATGPWLGLTKELSWSRAFFGRLVEPFWPSLTFSTMSDRDDEDKESRCDLDPELFHDFISLRMLLSARRAGRWAVKYADRLRIPALLIHGELDPVTSPLITRQFGERAGDVCTVEILPGMYHNVHEEDDEVVRQIADWLISRVAELGSGA
jgi:alpha-beta hydrolase superfamily lysophospholipase